MSKTLQQKINTQPNDYSRVEESFREKTGLELVTDEQQLEDKVKCNESVSVVISCYMGDKTLPLMFRRLETQTYKNFEVVVVDDGSPENMFKTVINLNPKFKTKFIRQTRNRGRSYTRNTGMLAADGDSVIFTDQDIIFDQDFVLKFAIRQFYTKGCIFIGFKEDVDFKNLKRAKKPNLHSDWRYSVKGETFFIPLYPQSHSHTKTEARKYQILQETDNLKTLGYGEKIGFWDLPSLIISHGLSVKKQNATSAGGFPEKGFDGWGAQDIAFGARLIGEGNLVVPVLNNIYYHIAHERYSGSREEELKELKHNLKAYFALLDSINYNYSPEKRNIEKIKDFHNLKYYEIK